MRHRVVFDFVLDELEAVTVVHFGFGRLGAKRAGPHASTLIATAKVAPGAGAAADPALINVIATDQLGNVIWDRNGTPMEPRRVTDTALIQRLLAAESAKFIAGTFADDEMGKTPIALAMRNPEAADQVLLALIDPAFLTAMLESVQGSRSVSLAIADAQSRKIAGTTLDEALYASTTQALPAAVTTSPALRFRGERRALSGDGAADSRLRFALDHGDARGRRAVAMVRIPAAVFDHDLRAEPVGRGAGVGAAQSDRAHLARRRRVAPDGRALRTRRQRREVRDLGLGY